MKKYWLDAKVMNTDTVSHHYTPSLAAKSTFFYVQDIGHYRCGTGYYTKREGYRSFLLIYTVSGNGAAKYRNREYELNAGSILLMDCYDYQEYFTVKDSLWDIKWMHFYGSTSHEYFNLIYEKHGSVIEPPNSDKIHEVLDEILNMAANSDFLPEARVSMLITQILTDLLTDGGYSGDGYHARVINEHVKLGMEFVDKYYNSNISLSDMASYSCCSEYHFSRLFKKITGYSPYEFIVKYRINEAKNLLKNTDISVEEISDSVGFGSCSNLIRTFKEIEGMTPLKYRRYWR